MKRRSLIGSLLLPLTPFRERRDHFVEVAPTPVKPELDYIGRWFGNEKKAFVKPAEDAFTAALREEADLINRLVKEEMDR